MQRKLVLAGLAVALATAAGPPVAGIGQSTDPEPTDDPAPAVVTVNATSGQRASPPVDPGLNVTVRVENVEPSAGGFNLVGPPGPLFVNQSSRSDGVVEFWYVPAMPGNYSIQRERPEGSQTLATVNLTKASGTGTGNHQGGDCASTYGSTYDCSTGARCGWEPSEKLAEDLRWTPLILVNSPYRGSAEASRQWSDTESVFLAPAGWSSRTVTATTIDEEEGRSEGVFQLAKWGVYENGGPRCHPDTGEKTARVVDWQPQDHARTVVRDFTGDSPYTSRSNDLRVRADGHRSLRFDTRYYDLDRVFDTSDGDASYMITSREIVAMAGSVTVGGHWVAFDVLRFNVADGDKLSYTYHFPQGDRWFAHELARSPGLAFCSPSYADCR